MPTLPTTSDAAADRLAAAKRAVSGRYYPAFDYLRMGLALGVFASHAGWTKSLSEDFGNACVQVFFALSGFLIGGILIRSHPTDLVRFYFNRGTRIWIPYFVANIALAFGCVVKRQPFDAKVVEFFFYQLTFVYNIFGTTQLAIANRMPLDGTGNHFWSICVEEQFYLVAPLLLIFARRASPFLLLGLWLINLFHPHYFPSISLGVLLALSQARFGDWFLTLPGRVAAISLSVVSVVAIITDVVPYGKIISLPAVCVVALLGVTGKQSSFGSVVGGISYPFYLNHWVGLILHKQLKQRFYLPNFAASVITLLIALAFSGLLYAVIDRQIVAKRGRWYSPRVGWWITVIAWTLAIVGLAVGAALRPYDLL